ncbi:MAG TPA: hypothetical protein VHY91_02330 [Pirellulales bacterium]|jgi:hypothetical protein|nr:hypothetical protein [Pirellulales bacterium]
MIRSKDTAVMNPLHSETPAKASAPLTEFERNAIEQRLVQIAVALGHPTWTVEQWRLLIRQQAELQRTLAAADSR